MMVTEAAKKLNFFPSKSGVSAYYSPRMTVHKKTLDYNKHCKCIQQEIHVQSHEEPKPLSTNTARTTECIYLSYNDNYQGGHELLNLRTKKIITSRSITEIPITNNIIEMVENLAKNRKDAKRFKSQRINRKRL